MTNKTGWDINISVIEKLRGFRKNLRKISKCFPLIKGYESVFF